MPRIVTSEEFAEVTPTYVDRVHRVVTAIFDRLVANPAAGIEVRATIFNADAPDTNYKERIIDPARIAELWGAQSRLDTIELDAPIDNGRIAVEDDYVGPRRTRIWVYGANREYATALDNSPQQAEGQSGGWMTSATRRHLGSLMLPGYIFETGHTFADGFAVRPTIFTYVYTLSDVRGDMDEYHGATGAANLFPKHFRDAVAPPCSAADAQLLGHNVQTYHTAKIGLLLTLLEDIVPEV